MSNENQPRVPAGQPGGGEWASQGATAESNKAATLDRYQAIADKSLPGKGAAARAVIEKGWDAQATEFVHPARLESMRYHIDDSLAMNAAKGIVQRQPALNDEIRKLKG
jgi:hypothetical protein